MQVGDKTLRVSVCVNWGVKNNSANTFYNYALFFQFQKAPLFKPIS